MERANAWARLSAEVEMGSDIAELELTALQEDERLGTPSGFACPECGGALWELHEGELIRSRCRVGHAFSANCSPMPTPSR